MHNNLRDVKENVNALDVVEAVKALIAAGMSTADFCAISDSPVTALRIALSVWDCQERAVEGTLFEVVDIPVYLTEWARYTAETRGACWLTVCRDETWRVTLVIEKPTFGDQSQEFPQQESVIELKLGSENQRREFDRILRVDFEDLEITPEEPTPQQNPLMTVLKVQRR